mgnify:FL=1
MNKIFINVPDGLPDEYSTKIPETGEEDRKRREDKRRIFNTLYEIGSEHDKTTLLKIDKWGLESFKRAPIGIFQPDQIGVMVISSFEPINVAPNPEDRLPRIDVGVALTLEKSELNLIFDPEIPLLDQQKWQFLHRVAQRLEV